jgi:hypothetical protein
MLSKSCQKVVKKINLKRAGEEKGGGEEKGDL